MWAIQNLYSHVSIETSYVWVKSVFLFRARLLYSRYFLKFVHSEYKLQSRNRCTDGLLSSHALIQHLHMYCVFHAHTLYVGDWHPLDNLSSMQEDLRLWSKTLEIWV